MVSAQAQAQAQVLVQLVIPTAGMIPLAISLQTPQFPVVHRLWPTLAVMPMKTMAEWQVMFMISAQRHATSAEFQAQAQASTPTQAPVPAPTLAQALAQDLI